MASRFRLQYSGSARARSPRPSRTALAMGPGAVCPGRRRSAPALSVPRTQAIRSAAVSHSIIHSPTCARCSGSSTLASASARRPAASASNSRAASRQRKLRSSVRASSRPFSSPFWRPSSCPWATRSFLRQQFGLVRPERRRHQRLSGPRTEDAPQILVLLPSEQVDQPLVLLLDLLAVACPLQCDQRGDEVASRKVGGLPIASSSRKYRYDGWYGPSASSVALSRPANSVGGRPVPRPL